MAKKLEVYNLGVVIDANAANALRAFAATDKAASGLATRFKHLRNAGESLARLGVGWSATVTAPISLLGKSAIDAAKDFDSLQRGMTAVSGSAEAARAEITQLREVAKLPGLGFKEAIQGSISLQAAGLSADLARRSLGAFGNALATVGKGKAELDGVALALSQISSKGKVSAEEINQIAERVPQIRQAMNAAFGTADTEAIQKQGITATDFITRVVAELEKLPKAGGGAANAFENLSDTIDQALVPVGNVLLKAIVPAIEVMTPAIETLSQKFSELSPTTQAVIVGAGVFAAALGPVLVALGAVTAAIGALGAPAVAVIAGLGAAAVALGAAWTTNFGGIREITSEALTEIRTVALEQGGVIIGWWQENLPLIKQTVQTVLNAIKSFWDRHGGEITAIVKTSWEILKTTVGTAIKTVLGVIKAGMQIINGDWQGAWETVKATARGAVEGTLKIVGLLAQRAWQLVKLTIGSLLDLAGWAFKQTISLGTAIVDGIIEGGKARASWLWQTVKEIALGAYQAAKDALGIHSPSRVFAEIGRNVVDGFIHGIKVRAPEVKKALGDLLKEATATATAIALLSHPQVFAARNRNADLADRKSQAEEVFDLLRQTRTLENVPRPPLPNALPATAEGLAALQKQLQALQQLNAVIRQNKELQPLLRQEILGALSPTPATLDIITEKIVAQQKEEQKEADKTVEAYQRLKEQLQDIIDATNKLTAAQKLQRDIAALPPDLPIAQRQELESLAGRARSVEIRQEQDSKVKPTPPTFGGLFSGMGAEITGPVDGEGNPLANATRMQGVAAGMKQAFAEVQAIGTETFNQWAQGIGSMLSDWVLLGETGPAALKKMTAQVLASAAQESAVLAIIETAKGFATMFLNPPESASHFTAAAIFASVAGATALAGRAIAGNSFKQNQRGSSSSARENREITSEGFSGNRFSREAFFGTTNKVVETLLQRIDSKLQPVNGDTLVVSSIRRNPQAVGSATVQAINQNDQLSRRLGQRITA